MPTYATDDKLIPIYARLWRDWVRRYWRGLALTVVCMIVVALASAGYSKLIQAIIAAFEASDRSVIWWAPVSVVTLAALKGFGQFYRMTLANRVFSHAEADLKKAMFRSLLTAELSRFQEESPAALSIRFSNDINLMRLATLQIFNGVSAILIILTTLVFMLTIDWLLTLIMAGVLSFAMLPVNIVGARLKKVAVQSQQQVAQMTAGISEGLSAIRMVRTYRLERQLEDASGKIFDELYRLNLKTMKWKALISPIMEILAGTAIAILLLIIAWKLANGTTTLADFMGLLTGLGVVSQPARRLGGVYTSAKQGSAALERIFGLLDTVNPITDSQDARTLTHAKGDLRFEKVDFAYLGAKGNTHKALDNITLDIPAGKKIAFVGRSGAGKSTFFNLIPRLYDVTGGAITLDGVDLRELTQASLRDQIALVGQDSVLLSGSIADNLGFGRPSATRAEVEAAAKAAAAHEFIAALPQGYDTQIGESGGGFSGGERQRLSIARAILKDAPILLLDEPTSALDAESEAAIRKALDRLSKNRTTLIIAHRLASILDADRIIVLDKGRIIEQGTHDDLLARGGLYKELYTLQFSRSAA
jgi:ATP-binding cassette, subfamily B, bacterial MsbA